MSGKVTTIKDIKGLSETEIPNLQQRYGKNSFRRQKPRHVLHIMTDIIREPMFILLMFACAIYFIVGHPTEGFMMLMAILLVAAISLYQDVRSTRACKL